MGLGGVLHVRDDEALPAAIDVLRARLLELRRDALRQMIAAAPAIDGGLMRVIADAGAVLSALDEEGEADRAAVQPR